MNASADRLRILVAVCLLTVSTPSLAHLMEDQHGTLNFVNGGAFLVLSIPVSAFAGVDKNDDGELSAVELSQSITRIETQILDGVRLIDNGEALPLQGLMISISPPDHDRSGESTHLVALGRFPADTDKKALALEISLAGESLDERRFKLTARRDGESQELEFVPGLNRHALFPETNPNE